MKRMLLSGAVLALSACVFAAERPQWSCYRSFNKEFPDYASFDAAELARELKDAGAHAWCDFPSVVHANARLFSVHLKEGGAKTIRLPRRAAKVVELFSGKTVATDADRFDYAFQSPDTRIFEIK